MSIDYEIDIKRIDEVTCCRKCKSNRVKETRRWALHSNGHWNESIEFECGAKYSFSPNYMRVGLAAICRNNPDFRERKILVEAVRQEIFQLGAARGLHEEDLNRLKSNLEYWKVYD